MMDPSQWHTGSLGGMHGCVEVESYWKDEVETRKAFTNDGWLKTGDIGTKRHFPENILLFGADS
jgi:hypothetical protein